MPENNWLNVSLLTRKRLGVGGSCERFGIDTDRVMPYLPPHHKLRE
jgi:hypothetical protein